MIRGLYTSGWSMLSDTRKMDVISNNLANVNTNAFKKDTAVFESFPEVLTKRINDVPAGGNPRDVIGTMSLGRDVGEVFTYYGQGQLTSTGNNLDFAIKDSNRAFFTIGVQQPNGEIKEYYTKDGAFSVNAEGMLVTKEGYSVMGQDGPVYIGNTEFEINPLGDIIRDGNITARLDIKSFADTGDLRKIGSNLVEATEEAVEEEFRGSVVQGCLEMSNVNIIKEMVDMISVTRSYEANQKVLQTQDDTLGKAVNEVGAVR